MKGSKAMGEAGLKESDTLPSLLLVSCFGRLEEIASKVVKLPFNPNLEIDRSAVGSTTALLFEHRRCHIHQLLLNCREAMGDAALKATDLLPSPLLVSCFDRLEELDFELVNVCLDPAFKLFELNRSRDVIRAAWVSSHYPDSRLATCVADIYQVWRTEARHPADGDYRSSDRGLIASLTTTNSRL